MKLKLILTHIHTKIKIAFRKKKHKKKNMQLTDIIKKNTMIISKLNIYAQERGRLAQQIFKRLVVVYHISRQKRVYFHYGQAISFHQKWSAHFCKKRNRKSALMGIVLCFINVYSKNVTTLLRILISFVRTIIRIVITVIIFIISGHYIHFNQFDIIT